MAVHVLARSETDSPATPLAALLWQLGTVIGGLSDVQYRVERARGVSGSIGGHVRHCLDHVSALIEGVASGHVNYDARRRGTAVETSQEAAVAEIARLAGDLDAISSHVLHRPVQLLSALDTSGVHIAAHTSVARELAFVVSHTIHHLAVIALLLREQGIDVPPRFGYAPSTPAPASSAA
jgi:uncharacterized damage-inducible protein DinB